MKNIIKHLAFLFIAAILVCSFQAKQASAQWITETIVESYFEDYITTNPIGYGPDNTCHVIFEKKTGGWSMPTYELWYVEKTDGENWTEPVMITEPEFSTFRQSIEVSPEGDVYLGYSSFLDDFFLVKKNEETWDEIQIPEPEDVGQTGYRSLKVDHNGDIHVVWGRKTLSEEGINIFDIIYARNIDNSWEVIQIPNSSNQFGELKKIDVADDGTIHILALEFTETGDIPFYLTNRTDDESGWERINLETSYETHTLIDIECYGSDVHIAFEGKEDFFAPANIHYMHILEGVVPEPFIVVTEVDAVTFSFTLDPDGNPVFAYGEDIGWGDVGSMYLGYLQDGVFTDTLLLEADAEPLDAYLSIDKEGKLIAMVNLGFWEPNIYIMYEEMIPEQFSVSFDVMTEENEPLNDATITLGNHHNEPGDYMFMDMLPGTYNYTISKEGFQTVEGEVTIEDQNMEIDIHLPYEVFSVLFNVACPEQEPITDAIITLAEQTNESGNYLFEGIQPGVYDYLVMREGYFPEEGEITITDHSLELDIQLNVDNTGLNEFTHSSLAIFPNPASERVEISADGLIEEVVMYDMTGRIIQSCQPNSRKTILTINGVPTGIYIFSVKTDEGICNRKFSVHNN